MFRGHVTRGQWTSPPVGKTRGGTLPQLMSVTASMLLLFQLHAAVATYGAAGAIDKKGSGVQPRTLVARSELLAGLKG